MSKSWDDWEREIADPDFINSAKHKESDLKIKMTKINDSFFDKGNPSKFKRNFNKIKFHLYRVTGANFLPKPYRFFPIMLIISLVIEIILVNLLK